MMAYWQVVGFVNGRSWFKSWQSQFKKLGHNFLDSDAMCVHSILYDYGVVQKPQLCSMAYLSVGY